ncbi:MAG: hypothetical protein R3F43_22675 [bacterium]
MRWEWPGLFGAGVRVVVRGAGRSSFLAALRRSLLAAHGVQVQVPRCCRRATRSPTCCGPSWPARDAGEEGVGRRPAAAEAGRGRWVSSGAPATRRPRRCCWTDAHLQGRSVLLGLPLFVESPNPPATPCSCWPRRSR